MLHPTLITAQLAGASLGLVSGALNLGLAGNLAWRRAAGNLFFASLLATCACGAWLDWAGPVAAGSIAWALGFHLAFTAWLAARRERSGTLDLLALSLALSVGIAALAAAMQGGAGLFRLGYFLLAGIALFACGIDAQVYRAGLSTARREQRRQWRSVTALAVGVSAFMLDQELLPEHLRGSPLPFLPIALALAVLVWWLNRTPRGGSPVGRKPRRDSGSMRRHALGAPRLA